jgi:DNA-directed RNA polymerase specialized sigma24 family protein
MPPDQATVIASPSAVPGAKIASVRYKKDWSPTAGAFRQFLSWLDEGSDSDGEKYLEMRRRLVAYFDRKNCVAPDELADETLNRVARRLEEEEAMIDTPPARYCYITAKFVFLEYLRSDTHSQTSFAELPPQVIDSVLSTSPPETGALAGKEHLFDCLEECLAKLESTDRNLILGYYHGEQRTRIDSRRGLAASLSVTVNALSIRACRIRNKLELCVRKCSNEI